MRRVLFGMLLLGLLIGVGAFVRKSMGPDVIAIESPINKIAEPVEVPDAPYLLEDALQLAAQGLANLRVNVVDYSARMIKQERVNGELTDVNEMVVKIQNPGMDSSGQPLRPLRVYLKYLRPKSLAGREVVWCEDRFDKKLIVHEPGILALVPVPPLDPNGFLAMQGNRYSIDHIGLSFLTEELIRRGRSAPENAQFEVARFPDHAIGGQACQLIRIESLSRDAAVGFQRIDIAVDLKKMIPLHLSNYDWPTAGESEPKLVESYSYHDVIINPGFSDIDFDPQNPDYSYPK